MTTRTYARNQLSKLLASSLLTGSLAVGSVVFTGCSPKQEQAQPTVRPRQTMPRMAQGPGAISFGGISASIVLAMEEQLDLRDKLEAIEGVQIKTDNEGHVISVDLRGAGGGNAEMIALVQGLPFVTSLICSGPEITDEAVSKLEGHPSLQTINLYQRSQVTDEGVKVLATLSKLSDINLERAAISDQAFKYLAGSQTIKRIRAPRTKITSAGLAHLKDLKNLELLDLRDCSLVGDEGLSHLAGLTKMRNLMVWGPQITDAGMQHLTGMTELVALTLQDTGITDAGLEKLSGLTKIRELDCFRTRVGDGGLKAMANCKGLRKLKYRDTLVTGEGLAALANFPDLEEIDLSETKTNDLALETIAKLPKLTALNLWKTRVTDEGVSKLAGTKLKSLNLDDIWDVTDACLSSVGKIETLEFLHLGKTSVTDDGIPELKNLKNLKTLILENTTVSKKAVEKLKESLKDTEITY